ncbi:MAG: lipid-A-disaccharide synthase, partial [Calditrichaeota bacterium]|nr:lipid-A-disaccharide synthase [Calditrichota bacterium]
MSDPKRNILIIAGEPSGDRHAAGLVFELLKLRPDLTFHGIGGDEMREAGVELLFHIEQMSFLGFSEVIRHIPFIRKVFRDLKKWMKEFRPEAVILVDYPGFNLRLAKSAHNMNIRVVYYISPQLWAWGQNRIKKIRRYVDLMLVIFQFEQEFYSRHGIAASFVGHPLVDEIKVDLTGSEFRTRYKIPENKKIIGFLPGSRKNEVNTLLPEMVKSAELFQHRSEVEWVVGKSVNVPRGVYDAILEGNLGIRLIEKDIYALMKYSRVVVVASGTATLETGYLETPMVVLYKISPLTYHIGKCLVKIKNIAMANIVLQKRVVPELVQKNVTPENICRELSDYFGDEAYYQSVAA